MAENKEIERQTLGRPSTYETMVAPRLAQLKNWKQNGLTDQQIAAKIGVALRTLVKYKSEHRELREVLTPPAPDPEKIERRLKREKINRQKSFDSFKSFIRNRATTEEYVELLQEICDYSPLVNFPKFREIVNEREAVLIKSETETLWVDDSDLPF